MEFILVEKPKDGFVYSSTDTIAKAWMARNDILEDAIFQNDLDTSYDSQLMRDYIGWIRTQF